MAVLLNETSSLTYAHSAERTHANTAKSRRPLSCTQQKAGESSRANVHSVALCATATRIAMQFSMIAYIYCTQAHTGGLPPTATNSKLCTSHSVTPLEPNVRSGLELLPHHGPMPAEPPLTPCAPFRPKATSKHLSHAYTWVLQPRSHHQRLERILPLGVHREAQRPPYSPPRNGDLGSSCTSPDSTWAER